MNVKFITKKEKQQALAQYPLGGDMEQNVVAKFFNPYGQGTWYLMNMDKDEDYCWGIVNLFETEIGSFSLKELEHTPIPTPFGNMKIERDRFFEPMPAKEVWERLQDGQHV